MSMNFEQARFNMVEQQVRPWEVLDSTVLQLMERLHREDYVPVRYRKLAFADLCIPLDHGQSMMKPIVEGRLLQALEIRDDESVLEVGTGSAWLTACLAHLAYRVVSVDIFEDLADTARRKLDQNEVHNVELECGDVMGNWQPEQAHDVLVMTGSVKDIPEHIQGWVNPGGRMFVVTGDAPVMTAKLCKRLNTTEWREETLFETDLPRLVNAEPAAHFEF